MITLTIGNAHRTRSSNLYSTLPIEASNNLTWIGVAMRPKPGKNPRILNCFIIHAANSVRIANDAGMPTFHSTVTFNFLYLSISIFPQLSPSTPCSILSLYPKSSPSPSLFLSPSQSQLKQIFVGKAHQTVTCALPVCKYNCLILFDWAETKICFLKEICVTKSQKNVNRHGPRQLQVTFATFPTPSVLISHPAFRHQILSHCHNREIAWV